MSARVMNCLEELAPRVEQYSIDEMFLDLTGVEHYMELEDFGRQLRQHVYDCTRLTIGVGAGPTKTLAKSAQWASKEWKQFRGVLALTRGNPQRTRKLLSLQPVVSTPRLLTVFRHFHCPLLVINAVRFPPFHHH